MFSGRLWELHAEADLWKIDAAAVRLLTQTGCRLEHEGLLALMEGAGCRVDLAAMRAYFPEELIRRALQHLGGGARSREVQGQFDQPDLSRQGYAGAQEIHQRTRWNPQPHLVQDGNYPHLLEWPSGRRHLASREDVVAMAQLGHALPDFAVVGKVLNCHDVDQRIEPLWYILTLAGITDKHLAGGEIFFAEYIEPLVQMASALSGQENDTS